jgi:hypothetical protein
MRRPCPAFAAVASSEPAPARFPKAGLSPAGEGFGMESPFKHPSPQNRYLLRVPPRQLWPAQCEWRAGLQHYKKIINSNIFRVAVPALAFQVKAQPA